MQINTEIKDVIVTIDGKDYIVAEKTVDVAERLKKVESAHVGKSTQYELWLAQLEIMLGRDSVRELFPKGRGENLDRMENIYYGVLSAFDHNGAELRDERYRETMDTLAQMSDRLKPLTEIMERYPAVGRK